MHTPEYWPDIQSALKVMLCLLRGGNHQGYQVQVVSVGHQRAFALPNRLVHHQAVLARAGLGLKADLLSNKSHQCFWVSTKIIIT